MTRGESKSANNPWNPSNSTGILSRHSHLIPKWETWQIVTPATFSNVAGLALKRILVATVALYILNQKHFLPRPLSGLVSKTLFWPTLPITLSTRYKKWITRIDDTLVMGGAPFGFLEYPEHLHENYGVGGVINMCEEYRGPLRKYKELGMEELHLPTTDHFEPTVDDLISAVSFIRRHKARGNNVYVHCRAGHGRSAAAVLAWLMYKDPNADMQDVNRDLCKLRRIRSTLWKQPNLQKLQTRFQKMGPILLDVCEPDTEDP